MKADLEQFVTACLIQSPSFQSNEALTYNLDNLIKTFFLKLLVDLVPIDILDNNFNLHICTVPVRGDAGVWKQ